MKFIQRIFDRQRKHFTGRGKFRFLHPLFEATETFFFIPGHTTASTVQIRDSLDLKRLMSFVILGILPCFLWGIYNTGAQTILHAGMTPDSWSAILTGLKTVIPLVIVSYGTGLFWELVFASVRGHNISEGFLVTGLLYPLILPPTVPLWQAAVGISFGVIIGKEIFGGTGRNILNPALTARAFLFFAYPVRMSGDAVWTVKTAGIDAVSQATPLSVAALVPPAGDIQVSLAQAGYSFHDLLLGTIPGSIGETSALLSFLAAIFLMVTGVASFRIIIGGIAGLLCTAAFLSLFESANPWFHLNPLYHLVMGGFAFGITFMATDPVTAPGMEGPKWIYGFFIGMLTVMIRVFNPAYPEGVMLAILFMNLFSPLFDYFAIRTRLKKRIPNV